MLKQTIIILLGVMLGCLTGCSREQATIFKGPTTNVPIDLSKYDMSSEIQNSAGKLVTTITVKNGKMDFTRPAGTSRTEFLKSLRDGGMRRISSLLLGDLAISSQGQLSVGLFTAAKGDVPAGINFLQALKEDNEGFDLNIGDGSRILDANSKVLATISDANGTPSITFAPGQSLQTLYEAGLDSFYYKFDSVGGQLKKHEVKIIKGANGELTLL